jgi:hypothetical protein
LATAKHLPVVLDQIITELVMSASIFNIPMCLDKSSSISELSKDDQSVLSNITM